MCDDCESEWDSPEEAKDYSKSLNRVEDRVQDATPEEIRKLGWTQFLKDGF